MLKCEWTKGETSMKIGRGFRQEWCLSPILFNFYGKCLTKEACEGFGDFEIGEEIGTLENPDVLMLLAKGEKRYHRS